jgi:hypothetical protein
MTCSTIPGSSPYSFRVEHICPATPGTNPQVSQAQNMASPSAQGTTIMPTPTEIKLKYLCGCNGRVISVGKGLCKLAVPPTNCKALNTVWPLQVAVMNGSVLHAKI